MVQPPVFIDARGTRPFVDLCLFVVVHCQGLASSLFFFFFFFKMRVALLTVSPWPLVNPSQVSSRTALPSLL